MYLLFSRKVFRDKLSLVLLTIFHCLLRLVRLLAPVIQRILPRSSDSSDYRVLKLFLEVCSAQAWNEGDTFPITKEKLFCCNVITKSILIVEARSAAHNMH